MIMSISYTLILILLLVPLKKYLLKKLMQLINFASKYTQKIFFYNQYYYNISSQTYRILVITITVTRMTTKEDTNDPANIS